ncbi:hypothetical protein [Arthrobacter sp. PsM3]|uniref:hypothetical protein n=1 Tax=Arthrobacter sp. PsM3 TaxID=3030531 RepID=UPI00263BDEF4|nr:hypothetical protein [Arthrobacter sp. PsM3]MDN4645926.1 hypothetical protein [Arthrobacter sp. PsM3]
MAQISARTAKWAKWSVVPAALLISGVAVSQASYSAFSSTVASPASNWTAGTVKIESGAINGNGATGGTAMFTATGMKPGSTGSKCITVTSSGSLASAVKLYATDAKTANEFGANVDLVITEGTAPVENSCKDFTALTPAAAPYIGTLADFGAKNTSFGTGFGTWTPAGNGKTETRGYMITYTMKTGAPNTTQGGTASMGFTWEAQNS